jgi:acetyl/propionyl-CoA carboxylase alpha subunit
MSKIGVTIDGHSFEIEIDLNQRADSELTVHVDGEPARVILIDREMRPDQLEWIIVDNRPYEIVLDPDLSWIKTWSGLHRIEVQDLEARMARPVSRDGRIKAPIPGLIKTVLIAEGDQVEAGQALLVLEAMKMENEIHAPRPGIVTQLNVSVGQSVMLNEVLAEIT